MPRRTQQLLIYACVAFSFLIVCSMIYLVHDTMADATGHNSIDTKQSAIGETDNGVCQKYEISMPEVDAVQRQAPLRLLSEARPDLYKEAENSKDNSSKADKIPAFVVPTEIKVSIKDTLVGQRDEPAQPIPKCRKCTVISEGGMACVKKSSSN